MKNPQSALNGSIFSQRAHPFVWTSAEDRGEVLANVDEPVWHRFLEEAEAHFAARGQVSPTKFPAFCHDGDLDEAAAIAVLAYVRDDPKYWRWLGGWLRGVLDYYRAISPQWQENQLRVMRGESATGGNPRQFFEGFTRDGMYWVEAGLTSFVFHLVDLLEAYAPAELSVVEKAGLLEAIENYATRFAFHEEAVKYNNRGMWANAGVLLSSVASADAETGRLLRFQAERRNDEYRSTFLDDGFHAEGAPDYHLMAADGLLAYALTASHLEPARDYFSARSESGLFQSYPSFLHIARAYLRTVLPGPTPWNNPRGCSISAPVTVRPSLLLAWKISRDPEIGWLLKERMGAESHACPTPLSVTKTALLGLGHYQPLLNFWLFRPVDKVHVPRRTRDVLPDYGGFFSRSGWDAGASCVTGRYGYEGTAKGHRDHGHVTVTVGGHGLLTDPFPRYGPAGLDSSLFHNTVTLDHHEPAATVGLLQAEATIEGADAFLINNSGGRKPDRSFLHDPREESNYWFRNQPEVPDHSFQRAILHIHERMVIGVDRVTSDRERLIDWFFHSDLAPASYEPSAEPRISEYRLRQRNVGSLPKPLAMTLRGESASIPASVWHDVSLGEPAARVHLCFLSPRAGFIVEHGHLAHAGAHGEEVDYFTRVRAESSSVDLIWMLSWGPEAAEIELLEKDSLTKILVHGPESPIEWNLDFNQGAMRVSRSAS